jgi:hypothetical protein
MLMLRQIYLVNKKQIPLTLFEMSVLTGERSHAGALAKCISRILPVAVLGSSLTKVTLCGDLPSCLGKREMRGSQ